MFKKRGQISIFIIVGILVLLVGGILMYVYMIRTDIEPEMNLPEEVHEISNYIESCLERYSEPAIRELAFKGGTYDESGTRYYDGDNYKYLCIRESFL